MKRDARDEVKGGKVGKEIEKTNCYDVKRDE